MISFVNVSKYFPGPGRSTHVVLNRANMRVDRGERVGILAPGGAGKTTLARLITGAINPSAGAITRAARISWPMGYSAALHPALTAAQNCVVAARLYNLDPTDLTLRVEHFAQIGGAFVQPVSLLAPAQRLQVAMGLSLSVDFDIYVADEYSTVTSPEFQDKVEAALEARLAGAGLILLTRHRRLIERMTSRTLVLADSKLIECSSPEEAGLILELSQSASLEANSEIPHAAA